MNFPSTVSTNPMHAENPDKSIPEDLGLPHITYSLVTQWREKHVHKFLGPNPYLVAPYYLTELPSLPLEFQSDHFYTCIPSLSTLHPDHLYESLPTIYHQELQG